jgi:hypothetical protein
LSPVFSVFVSEVGKGDEEDEDNQANSQRDQESDVIDRRVQGGGRRLWPSLVDWSQLLVTKITVGAAGDAPRLEVRHQVAFALEQTLLISGQTAIGAFRYK